MDIEKILDHSEKNDGWCATCKKVTLTGCVEPDARKRQCPECARWTVYGMEEAVIAGLLEVEDE